MTSYPKASTRIDGQSGSETAGQEIETDTEMLYDRNPRRNPGDEYEGGALP